MKPIIAGRSGGRSGFTLVETLVVISIMAIASAMLLSGSKDSALQVVLSTSQATMAGVLNRAKALTLAKYTETQDPSELPCGFGVHFDAVNSALVIYEAPQIPSISCETPGHKYVPGNTIVQTLNLDPRIGFVGSPEDIVFIAPYLKTEGAAIITLQVKNGTQKAQVQVTVGGSITSL